MMYSKLKKNKKAQTILEFSLVLVVAIIAFIGMQPMVKRAVQGGFRSSADQLGGQFSPLYNDNTKVQIITSSLNQSVTSGVQINQYNTFVTSAFDEEIASIAEESVELREHF